ncbi:helix-turn-helix domain-containing protein [Slackia isoflavoniconvertens]|uniref:helix-turn-helix domain-containing protein n=1 Tax=Slackia isoflavoniconvertens TaxID=572010 RepID=UPI00307934D4
MEGQAYYTIPQLAEACGIPKSALYAAARRGDLKTTLPKGCERLKLVKREWLEEWIGAGE